MKTSKALSSSLESLESRIAPASVLLYTDADGDHVKIVSSKGVLEGHAVFKAMGVGQQLQILDLTDDSFAGANIRILVHKGAEGDGFANIGFLDAAGNDLGKVTIKGDLGKIAVGDGDRAIPALKLFRAHSVGLLGTSTQGGSYTGGGLAVAVTGLVDDLLGTVNGDGGLLADVGNALQDLLSRDDSSALPDEVIRTIAVLQSSIDTLLDGRLNPGQLPGGAGGLISNVITTLNDLLGLNGTGDISLGSALVQLVDTTLDTLDEVLTALPGSSLFDSLSLGSLGTGPLTINGQLGSQGLIRLDLGDGLNLNLLDLVEIEIGGGLTLGGVLEDLGTTLSDLLAGNSVDTLPQEVQTLITQVSSLFDSLLHDNAPLDLNLVNALSQLRTALGGLLGENSVIGSLIDPVLTHTLDTVVTAAGQILNGPVENIVDPDFSLTSNIVGNVKRFQVNGDVRDAFINIQGDVKSAFIRGTLDGGVFDQGGEFFVSGNLGSLKIGKNIVGGAQADSGSIHIGGKTGKILVRGSLVGSDGAHSGAITLTSDARLVNIRGDVAGGPGELSGSIVNSNGEIRAIVVRGSVLAGDGDGSASFSVHEDIHKLQIRKGTIGDATHRVSFVATALDSSNEAFSTVKIGGAVRHTDIFAGYDLAQRPINGNSSIGSISVRGDWVASNAVAGVTDSIAVRDGFGNSSDTPIGASDSIVSAIATIRIRGNIIGTSTTGDHYGFVAEEIGRFSVGRGQLPLTAGAHNDDVALSSSTGDVAIREV